MRMNELLEEDLRTLKETDIMGPVTRAEYNRRKKAAAAASDVNDEQRKLDKKPSYDFSSFDEILKKKKSEQLEVARTMFGS